MASAPLNGFASALATMPLKGELLQDIDAKHFRLSRYEEASVKRVREPGLPLPRRPLRVPLFCQSLLRALRPRVGLVEERIVLSGISLLQLLDVLDLEEDLQHVHPYLRVVHHGDARMTHRFVAEAHRVVPDRVLVNLDTVLHQYGLHPVVRVRRRKGEAEVHDRSAIVAPVVERGLALEDVAAAAALEPLHLDIDRPERAVHDGRAERPVRHIIPRDVLTAALRTWRCHIVDHATILHRQRFRDQPLQDVRS
jgi:hypothetical protein